MDGINYQHQCHAGGVYYAPVGAMPPSETMSFNSSFSSQPDYVVTPYSVASNYEVGDAPGHANHSFSEPFAHLPAEPSNMSAGPAPNHAIYMTQTSATSPNMTRFPALPISPSQIPPRQKAKRTPTACEECRKRKQKCDGETPCQACKKQELMCGYQEVSPTKKDNALEKIMSLVETYSKTLNVLGDRLGAMSSTLRQIEQRLTRCGRCGSTVELSTGNCEACGHTSRAFPIQFRFVNMTKKVERASGAGIPKGVSKMES